VAKVIQLEEADGPVVSRDWVLFAPDCGLNDATHFSHAYMAKPLSGLFGKRGFRVEKLLAHEGKGFGPVVTSAVRDRMPVILDPDGYDLWLDPGMRDASAASELLKPCDARLMQCYPVSTRINHVTNDDRECSRPVEVVHSQNRLFI